jgi:hypothetical protein
MPDQVISGKIFHGQGDASKNYPTLLERLSKYVPGLKSFHPASINIELQKALERRRADVWTPRVQWDATMQGHLETRIEAFGFTGIKIAFPPSITVYEGMIFAAEGAYSAYDPYVIEVILPKYVSGIEEICSLQLDHEPIQEAPHDFGRQFGIRFQRCHDWPKYVLQLLQDVKRLGG